MGKTTFPTCILSTTTVNTDDIACFPPKVITTACNTSVHLEAVFCDSSWYLRSKQVPEYMYNILSRKEGEG